MFYSWYFGELTRNEAERALKSAAAATGSFLIRESETRPSKCTVEYAQVERTGEKHFSLSHPLFDLSVNDGQFKLCRQYLDLGVVVSRLSFFLILFFNSTTLSFETPWREAGDV